MKYLLFLFIPLTAYSLETEVGIKFDGTNINLTPEGKNNREWVFESSKNLKDWSHVTSMMPVFSGEASSANKSSLNSWNFFRASRTEGFYDPRCLRVIDLKFESEQWQNLLTQSYSSGEEILGSLQYRNETFTDVGIRYKGNTSYTRSGEKKSIKQRR